MISQSIVANLISIDISSNTTTDVHILINQILFIFFSFHVPRKNSPTSHNRSVYFGFDFLFERCCITFVFGFYLFNSSTLKDHSSIAFVHHATPILSSITESLFSAKFLARKQ